MVSIMKTEFEQIYRDYYMLVYKYIFKKINNTNLTEDLTSDIFFKAFQNYENYNSDRASVKTWLFKITENRLKNYYRDKKITVDINDEDNISTSTGDIMLEAALLQECRDTLADALDTLSEKYRKAIILKFFYDKTTEEIALELNTTAGNVRIISMRALKKLSQYFLSRNLKLEDYI